MNEVTLDAAITDYYENFKRFYFSILIKYCFYYPFLILIIETSNVPSSMSEWIWVRDRPASISIIEFYSQKLFFFNFFLFSKTKERHLSDDYQEYGKDGGI